jgi:serine/threonine-protein kinase HipA
MKRCPITYEPVTDQDYSVNGLKLLDRRLRSLEPLAYTAEQQRQEALKRVGKMSIQGMQLKLSAVLSVSSSRFQVVDRNGRFILKPPSLDFPELPANEDLMMHLAATIGIEVPLHGMIYAQDRSLTYFIRRFDRPGRRRTPVEDFAQLSGADRSTKYDSSMEKVAEVINRYCTFPAIERIKLLKRAVFSFLTGNEDMHLKNFSLITYENGRVDLAPAYDLVNSTIAIKNAKEEMALPIKGKKSGLTQGDLLDYYGHARLELSNATIDEMVSEFQAVLSVWGDWIRKSFLSADQQNAFEGLVAERAARLQLKPASLHIG